MTVVSDVYDCARRSGRGIIKTAAVFTVSSIVTGASGGVEYNYNFSIRIRSFAFESPKGGLDDNGDTNVGFASGVK